MSRVLCPSCSARLIAGALRCRHCGGDARGAPEAPLPGVEEAQGGALLHEAMNDPILRRLEGTWARLWEEAPAVARWRGLPKLERANTRPPPESRRASVREIEREIDELGAGLREALRVEEARSEIAAQVRAQQRREAALAHYEMYFRLAHEKRSPSSIRNAEIYFANMRPDERRLLESREPELFRSVVALFKGRRA